MMRRNMNKNEETTDDTLLYANAGDMEKRLADLVDENCKLAVELKVAKSGYADAAELLSKTRADLSLMEDRLARLEKENADMQAEYKQNLQQMQAEYRRREEALRAQHTQEYNQLADELDHWEHTFLDIVDRTMLRPNGIPLQDAMPEGRYTLDGTTTLQIIENALRTMNELYAHNQDERKGRHER